MVVLQWVRRYADFGNKCASAGFDVFAIDHFGHGRSPGYTEGAEGDVGEKGFFDGVVANAVDLVNTESAGKDLPVFIFGKVTQRPCRLTSIFYRAQKDVVHLFQIFLLKASAGVRFFFFFFKKVGKSQSNM